MLDELKCQRNSKQYHDANKMTPQGAVLQKNYTSIYKLFSVFNMQSHGLFYLPSNSIFYASQISCMIQDMTSLQCVFRIMHFPLSIFHLFQFVKQQNIIFYSVQKEKAMYKTLQLLSTSKNCTDIRIKKQLKTFIVWLTVSNKNIYYVQSFFVNPLKHKDSC